VKDVSKAFPGVQALDNMDFEVYPSEIVALLGENGAGKSTLMKILVGAYQKDGGQIFLDGKQVEIDNPSDAMGMGLAIIYQEFNLTPTQTVAANIFISREPRQTGLRGAFGFVDRKRMEREAETLLGVVGANVAPDAIIRTLSVADRQQV
jgi:ribose transport system ATP-binding protein